MLSPVCTPIGSIFSIEQMTTALSIRSRITSSSNSFHPIRDSSISASPYRTLHERPFDQRVELALGIGDAAALTAEREARADDDGKPRLRLKAPGRLEVLHDRRPRRLQADLRADLLERTPILGPADGFDARADHLDPVLRENSLIVKRERQVEPVCPPIVGSTASGRSGRMISSTYGALSGSM